MVIWIAAIVLTAFGIMICLGVDVEEPVGTAKSRHEGWGALFAVGLHLLSLILVSQA